MLEDIKKVLKLLNIKDEGYYEDIFYVLPLKDSNQLAKMHTKLSEVAQNLEYPVFKLNTAKNTTGLSAVFTLVVDEVQYGIFLLGDFDQDSYKLKIREFPIISAE